MCDTPIIARVSISPCDHVLCYSCSLPYLSSTEKWCPICETSNVNFKRLPDKIKLFECDFPDCFKFYENMDGLLKHKAIIHNLQLYNMNQNQDNHRIVGNQGMFKEFKDYNRNQPMNRDSSKSVSSNVGGGTVNQSGTVNQDGNQNKDNQDNN